MKKTTTLPLLLITLLALPVLCAEQKNEIEYGPFISATFVGQWPKNSFTYKGVAVRFDSGKEALNPKDVKDGKAGDFSAGIIFDTDLLRVSAGWSGAVLKLQGIPFDMQHGLNQEIVKGAQRFGTSPGPGWAKGGNFKDPRAVPYGPLPAEWAIYKGLYRSGSKIVFSYNVGKCPVLESHSLENGVFFREFTIAPSDVPLQLMVCESEGNSAPPALPNPTTAVIEDKEGVLAAKIIGAPAGAEFSFLSTTGISLKLPTNAKALSFKIAIWSGSKKDLDRFAELTTAPAVDLNPLCLGGPAHWPIPQGGEGKIGAPVDSFAVDTLPIPESPLMKTSGFDFFKDGRAAVCTLNGDVWIVSGIDAELKKVTWKRYASGLFQPLGLKIVDDLVYVLGRDQITRLHDIAGNGEADFYENFNNDTQVSENFHEFALDLQTDSKGNFYFCKAGPVVPGGKGFDTVLEHHGCLIKVSKDGSKLEVVATGLRAANGMSIGPKDEITSADNEGTWTPSSRINFIKPGGFYGCPPLSHRTPPPTTYDPPMCWLPHEGVDNSSGGQVWVPAGLWGPLEGSLLHMSYGTSSLFLTMSETVDGIAQGGAVRIPLMFRSGIMRARFNPKDGNLYVSGLRGWQTTGLKWGCLQRVRYIPGIVHLPAQIRVNKDGVYIQFHCAIDKGLEADDFNVEQWNYRWTSAYGSAHYSASNPNKEGEDTVKIKSVQLLPDNKTVFLEIPNLKPVMQMKIKYNIKSADGVKLNQQIYNTINVQPQ